MSRYLSAEEVKEQYIDAMGCELGTVFSALRNQIIWLHVKWQQYRKLFGKNQERIDILNQTASFFFGILQDLMWDDIILHISKVVDPASTAGHENLTIQRLPGLVNDDALQSEVEGLVDETTEKADTFKDHRNKRIAHNDLTVAVNVERAKLLEGISRADVEDILSSMREVMNVLGRHYCDSEIMFEHLATTSDADFLITRLRQASEAKDTRLDL